MYRVPQALVANWSIAARVRYPAAVDLICPSCARKVTFSLSWGGFNDRLMFCGSRCPACASSPSFILVAFQEVEPGGDKIGQLFVSPAPKIRQPIEDVAQIEEFSEDLRRAYVSALNVFNTREWTATAVLCRRLLEGITLTMLPEDQRKGTLSRQLKALSEHRDLKKPIETLADAIRKGGNLGAHFDLEREPDEETVSLMIDLLDYLIEYLFILPKRIERLHLTIDSLGAHLAA